MCKIPDGTAIDIRRFLFNSVVKFVTGETNVRINLILSSVRVNTFAVSKQEVLHTLSVCL